MALVGEMVEKADGGLVPEGVHITAKRPGQYKDK